MPVRKNIGQTSDCTRASTIGKMSTQPQLRRSPHTAATERPPGLRMRRISTTARSGSGTYIKPNATQHHVEAAVFELEFFSVHAPEAAVGNGLHVRQRARRGDHCLRNVGAENLTAGCNSLCRQERHKSGTAGDVEHTVTRRAASHLQEGGLRRLQLRLPRTLVDGRGLVPAVSLHPVLQSCVHASIAV